MSEHTENEMRGMLRGWRPPDATGDAESSFAAPAGSAITFENNKGERLQLAGELTLADLVKTGVKEIRITKAEDPLPDGWWRDLHEPPSAATARSPLE